ncbi:MAG: patatin-like phospholipase family protein [Planctomycetaceae bacterium]|nr:patatin-like phospholipase family protein [Planctomycetaceae bacterium]
MTRNKTILSISIVITALLSGCAPVRHAVPENLIYKTSIPDMPNNIRVFDQNFIPDFKQDPNDANGCAFLALSGGGANGAFGAGVLYGWTQSGKRPQFQVVTGISTGALIAPLAFLGSNCDEELKQIYTSISDKDIFDVKGCLGFIGMLWNESYADTQPLSDLIEKTLTQEKIDAIAREHAKGRRLYVGTTYLDAQRFVVWDMGAIASSKSPKATELFRKVLLASSAFPGAFPPVCFEVAADGNMYDEMHVDGGVVTGVFCYFKPLSETGKTPNGPCNIYVIKNGIGAPDQKQVKRNAIRILEHSFYTMMKMQTWSDLNRIYWMARRDNAQFEYMCIPKEYVAKTKKMFDPREMKILFDIGYEKGKNCEWKNQLVID